MTQARALRLSAFGLDHLQLVSVEVPEPGPTEVLVTLAAASLNYRDLMTAMGWYRPDMKLPRILGSDAAGTVTAVGEKVTRFKVGDRVTSLFFEDWVDGEIQPTTNKSALGGDIDGVLTTARIFPESGLIPTPGFLTDQEAATLPCAAVTAWNGLMERGKLQPGETVLVMGTGGVSLFALQLAKAAGARVILTSSSDDKLARGRAMGADETINYRTTPEWATAAFELNGRRGVDHVVEVGGAGTLGQSLRAVRPGGHVYLIGVLSEPGKGVDIMPVLSKSLHFEGIYVGSRAMFERMNQAFVANQIRPVVDRTFPIEDAKAAFEHLQSGGHFGKIVIDLKP